MAFVGVFMLKRIAGGYRWLVWFLASSFVFYKYILEVSPGVLGHHMMSYYHSTGFGLGNLIAAYFYAYMLMQLPIGMILDRLGPKRVVSACLLLCVFGTLLMAYAPYYSVAFIARFITGLGAAAAVLGCIKLISIWFPQSHFAMLVGLMMTIGMLGAVSGDAVVQYCLQYYQWQHLIALIAWLGLILLLVFFIAVSDKKAPYSTVNNPEIPNLWQGLKQVGLNKKSWILSVYSGLMFAPISAFSGAWGVPFLHNALHFSLSDSANMMSLIFYGFAIGAPLWGWLSDLWNKRKVFLWMATLSSLLFSFCIIYVPGLSLWIEGLLLFLFGFTISSFVVSFTMIREVNPLILTATATGFMNAFNSISSAQIDTWIGYLLDKHWTGALEQGQRIYSLHSYYIGMSIVPLVILFALIMLPFVSETHWKSGK
mgnify:CR=1 FL=1